MKTAYITFSIRSVVSDSASYSKYTGRQYIYTDENLVLSSAKTQIWQTKKLPSQERREILPPQSCNLLRSWAGPKLILNKNCLLCSQYSTNLFKRACFPIIFMLKPLGIQAQSSGQTVQWNYMMAPLFLDWSMT